MNTNNMLELILLHIQLSQIPTEVYTSKEAIMEDGRKLNVKSMIDRFLELQDEFIKPYYVVSTTSKED